MAFLAVGERVVTALKALGPEAVSAARQAEAVRLMLPR
jgi:hypothetical protein